MAITYEYNIGNLEYSNDDSKGVVVAHYNVVGTEGNQSVKSYGTVSFSPKPDDPKYTPFEELTEETVLGWVKDQLDTAQIEEALVQKLNEKLNPTVVSGNLPWEGSTDEIDPELAPE